MPEALKRKDICILAQTFKINRNIYRTFLIKDISLHLSLLLYDKNIHFTCLVL